MSEERTMRTATLAALAAVLVLALAACGEDDDPADEVDLDEPTETEPDEDPSDDEAEDEVEDDDQAEVGDAEVGDAEDAEGVEEVTSFALRTIDGDHFVESFVVALDEPTVGVAGAAVEALVSADPADPGLEPAVEGEPEVLGVDLDDGVLAVDLDDAVHEGTPGGAAHEEAFAQALAHAAAQFDDVGAVRLHVDGEPVDELWGHLDWSEPIEPDPFLRADVDATVPAYGDEHPVGEPLTVEGTSLTFEATVQLDLVDPDGTVVAEEFTTADQPQLDERGPFSHTFEEVPDEPGGWTVVLRAPDPSDGEADRAQYEAELLVEVVD